MANKELNMETVLSQAYCQIWDNSLLGVMIMDCRGVFRYMNRLFTMTDDLQDEDALGKPMVDFYPLDHDSHMSLKAMETGQPVIKKTVVYYTHKKKLVNSLCSAFPLRSGGQVEGVIHFSLNLQMSQRLIERHQPGKIEGHAGLPWAGPYTFASIVGKDQGLKNAVTLARSASQTDFSVFIWAETGCGKELFAQSIHQASSRKNHPFVPINCAAIPDNLLETTLFGTVRGAFTGAEEKAGLLEAAQGGTLLLDELNSMSLELQAKLLRVIQEKKLRRVGALKEIPVDVRFMSTCNIPPAQALVENRIREDLFYRLGVVVLEIPPLCRRRADIPLLCEHFLAKWQDRSGHAPVKVSDRVYEIFDQYPWPGNVRELENTLQSCLAMIHGGTTIYDHHLTPYFMDNFRRRVDRDPGLRAAPGNDSVGSALADPDPVQHLLSLAAGGQGQDIHKICLGSTLKAIETLYIERALKRAGYNISKAGRFLNLSPQALRYRIKKLEIHVAVE